MRITKIDNNDTDKCKTNNNKVKAMRGAHFSISEEVDHSTDPNRATAMLHTIQQQVQHNFWESYIQ